MYALDTAQQQQQEVRVEHRQIQQGQQVQQAKHEGTDVVVEHEEDEVGNSSIAGGATSPPPSVAPIGSSEVGEPQIPGTNVPVSPVGNVTVATEHGEVIRRDIQPLFVHSNSQTQLASVLLNLHPGHSHRANASAALTPVVSPLASPIASPQPSYQSVLPASSSTSSTLSTSNNSLSGTSQNPLVWPIPSAVLSSIPLSNHHYQGVTATSGSHYQQQDLLLQPQQSHHQLPLFHHSQQHLQQQHHPIPEVLPQHPLQPSFNNPRTDPTVPPGCREHGFNLIGQKYLLHDQIEGSHLQRCIQVATQREYVCKTVRNDPVGQAMFSAHMRVDGHPHINPVEEVIVGESLTYLIFPPCHVDLHSYVRMKRRLREPTARALFRQIVSAVHEAHSKGIVLRDLKLRKFVFTDEARTTLKLESLEDAVVLENEEHDLLSDKHGCPAYVSPEILRRDALYSGRAADMWGLGVMLYTMLVGRYPFHGQEHTGLFAKIRRGQFTIPDSISSRAKCLIRCLLRKDPEERLTTDDVLVHPWVTQHHTTSASLCGGSGTAANNSLSTPSQHLHLNSSYAGSRSSGGNIGVAERPAVSTRGRAMPNGNSGNSVAYSTPMSVAPSSNGSSPSTGLPTNSMTSNAPSSLVAMATVAAPSVVASGMGIHTMMDPHNGMDQIVPESFHGGLGVSDKD